MTFLPSQQGVLSLGSRVKGAHCDLSYPGKGACLCLVTPGAAETQLLKEDMERERNWRRQPGKRLQREPSGFVIAPGSSCA